MIIECDENQHIHKSYTNCDTKRIMEIFQDFGNRPIIFIKFNPDKYINDNKIQIKSSFKNHEKLNIQIIRCEKEWNDRLSLLKNKIDYWLNNIPTKEITTEYLFYNKI